MGVDNLVGQPPVFTTERTESTEIDLVFFFVNSAVSVVKFFSPLKSQLPN